MMTLGRWGAFAFVTMMGLAGCDPTETAKECVAADLIGQCPAGSNPVLGAEASTACGGQFESNLVTDGMSASGQCGANGSCQFLCQFELPCSCGVASLTKEAIICSECQDQSCGDGRCEGTERGSCAPGQAGCFECVEDCAGPTCGDGDCTGDEDPTSCPQDCAATCLPGASSCLGTKAITCAANGRDQSEYDCATVGLLCAGGQCVAPDVCGNGICEGGESLSSCPSDCANVCTPSSRRCESNTLIVCAADGKSENTTDCGAAQVCDGGQCKPANVCGNGVCEANESGTCAQDCAAQCGNHVCENGEQTSCPGDCTTCGNATCEAGEQATCPQDCGICVPSEKQCLGKILRVCNANGTAYDDIDCDDFGLSCGGGNCVEPNVCGNGACEVGESEASCARDCAETCGNGTCGGTETFATCAVDCEPICGDGTCEGNENAARCSFDCLASCGDGACAAPESRVNCPGDCGFCGDGACQDGAESASLTPPQGQESCVVDCVVTSCGGDRDCDDDVACTTNQCRNGSCIYTPDDGLCGGDDRCIALNGCCGDGDGDGYADASCGGSDCNDSDGTVHPGANEVCGGADKNCNGTHAPALVPATKLTNTATAKRDFAVHDVGDGFVATWTGKPATKYDFEMLEVGWDLLARGGVRVVAGIEPNDRDGETGDLSRVAIAWNPTVGKFGASWVQGGLINPSGDVPTWDQDFAWISRAGVIDGEITTIRGAEYATGAVALNGTVVFPRHYFSTNWVPSGGRAAGFWVFDASGTPTKRDIGGQVANWDLSIIQPVTLNGLVAGMRMTGNYNATPPGRAFMIADLTGNTVSTVNGTIPGGTVDCVMTEDGELLATVCSDARMVGASGRVSYRRFGWSGAEFHSADVMTGDLAPLAIGKSKARLGATPIVGVLVNDRSNNLWFFVRDQAGDEVLAPSIIGGGNPISEAAVLHDGTDFIVVWLATVGATPQVFAQRVTCQ